MVRISQWKGKLGLSVAYAVVVGLAYALHIPCFFQSVFGIGCPGCGMTRAWVFAIQFDFKSAFFYHPMFWSLPILYLYFWLDDGLLPWKAGNRILLCSIGIGFLVNWVLNFV